MKTRAKRLGLRLTRAADVCEAFMNPFHFMAGCESSFPSVNRNTEQW